MLGSVSQADLKGRVEAAAAAALARQRFVTPIDVCVGIGWLHTSNVEDWHNHAHDAVSAVIYVDLVVVQALLARALARDAAWKPWPRWLAAGAATTTVALVAYGVNTAEPAAGVLQRVAVTLPLAAIAALAARLAILRQPVAPSDVPQ
jgi:Protein of unknown function (DUF998)